MGRVRTDSSFVPPVLVAGRLRFDRRHVAFLAALVLFATSLVVAAGATLDPAQAQSPPTLSVFSSSVSEGDSGTQTMTFTVFLNPCSTGTVTVNFATADGTATTADGDYVPTSGTLTFVTGDTSEQVTVTTNGDTTDESNEAFSLVLSGASGADIGSGTATGTIFDDDPLEVDIFSDSVTEGDSGTTSLFFSVQLNKPAPGPVAVDYSTAGVTATPSDNPNDNDYEEVFSGTLNFATGDQFKTATVVVNGETIDESNETLTMTLANPTGGLTIGTATATGTIIDDDPLEVDIFSTSVDEGDSGTTNLTFSVELNKQSPGTVTVDYSTSDGTATDADGDYVVVTNQTITFTAGEQFATATVVVNGDTVDEPGESLTVTLSNPTGGLVIGSGTATGTIFDDDPLEVNIFNDGVTEGDSGTTNLTFSVELNKPAPFASPPVSVDYSTSDGTATAGSDYVPVSNQTISFATGEQFKTATVVVNGDTTDESTEDLTVTLTNPTAGLTIGFDDTATGTIFDDDPAVPPGPTCGGGGGPPPPIPSPEPTPEPTPNPDPTPCAGDPNNLCATPQDDTITVDSDNITLSTGGGADTITVLGDNVTVNAGGGDDTVVVDGDAATVRGGSGHDSVDINGLDADVAGGPDGDDVCGGPGEDHLSGGGGGDSLCGGGGDDEVTGGDQSDALFGDTPQPEAARAMRSYADGETLSQQDLAALEVAAAAAGGNDILRGGLGADIAFGARGRDELFGGFGSDGLYGGIGNDELNGSDGPDEIKGGDGDDHIRAGAGRNVVQAGDGIDVCILNLKDEASGCETEKRRGHLRRGHLTFGGWTEGREAKPRG